MQSEIGYPHFPIWLPGDSNPKNWQDLLISPLDPRHPARHNIWTPIIDVIQDWVYRRARLRVETENLYIRNAIEDPMLKPVGGVLDWSEPIAVETGRFAQRIDHYKPVLVLTFGAFAFEFANRTQSEAEIRPYRDRTSKELGAIFRQRVQNFDVHRTNILPLLHATIARGKFLQSHHYFCDAQDANYFTHVGEKLADVLFLNKDALPIWIEDAC